ncbi:MAG: hypothetical protein KKF56_03165 [Nanoarchaeota archaeon]|nr:hypothetical protein [Nanoarchaeota archaeon]
MEGEIKNSYDARKIEIEELKKRIIKLFKEGKAFDSTLITLSEQLKLSSEDVTLLEYCLGLLVEEGWLKKSSSLDHYEYDPGEKLDYGGLE